MTTIIEQLQKNPSAKPSELVDVQEWEGLPKGIVLNEEQSFIAQVHSALKKYFPRYCNWEPFDEGYDGGPDPDELEDSWRKEDPSSTGSFRGVQLEVDQGHYKVVDALHAELIILSTTEETVDEDDVVEQIEEWVGPKNKQDSEQRKIKKIHTIFSELSKDSQAKALQLLQESNKEV
jgi:hypothetical protein